MMTPTTTTAFTTTNPTTISTTTTTMKSTTAVLVLQLLLLSFILLLHLLPLILLLLPLLLSITTSTTTTTCTVHELQQAQILQPVAYRSSLPVCHGCQAGGCAHAGPELSVTVTFDPQCVTHHQHCSPLVNKKHNKTWAFTPSLLCFYFLSSVVPWLFQHDKNILLFAVVNVL